MNSDTPETDAHQAQENMAHDWLWRDFACKLERERNAAIAELEAWRSEKGPEGWWVKHEDHIAQLNKMTLISTPETDAEVNEMRKSITYNMVTAAYARDLERRLTVAREALERITIWSTENTVLDVARNALTQTAPKP